MTTTTTSAGTARRETTATRPVSPWEHLAALLPLEDLTHTARQHPIQPAVTVSAPAGEELLVRPDPWDAAARTLYRTRRGNVLLTGRKGVGKTTFVRELARRAALNSQFSGHDIYTSTTGLTCHSPGLRLPRIRGSQYFTSSVPSNAEYDT